MHKGALRYIKYNLSFQIAELAEYLSGGKVPNRLLTPPNTAPGILPTIYLYQQSAKWRNGAEIRMIIRY